MNPTGADALPSYAELGSRRGRGSGTAWGLWGDADQLGTLNHLTPVRVLDARSSIRSGEVVPLNLPLTAFDPPIIAHRGSIEHTVFGLNGFHRDDRVDSLFLQASTQLDGLRHFGHPDKGFYNGADPAALVAGRPELGIQAVAERGVAGRGLVIDVGAYRDSIGRPIDHMTSEQIPTDDLDAALRWQGSDVLPGDIVMIRTGWLGAFRDAPHSDGVLRSPGLEQSERTAAWLWDRRVAVAAADNVALEAWPATGSTLTVAADTTGTMPPSSHSGMLHRILIPLLGLTIGELWDLDVLAAACAQRGHYDVFVTAQPLNLLGGVGSPANAMAIL
ncbi:cyclase family protein [Rathayibacter sp. VKM Ac-2927]|uniref:cyclase family protein n=1 Tax=Rathayibacter sp. VKM Ac-2927 TaxID=2929478 RepID=UPI001FB493B2|nr:cyclase family protein [Rathayibacter sp. VKM Ac-2927]MCJ1688343.1 cyclase family protein [Rathayibacter sp. VKM Ac-2927]